jgi:hypothetical protein
MRSVEDTMAKIWLLQGAPDAAGWEELRRDSQDEKVDIIHLDPHVWALMRSDEAPGGYEGLEASEPADGLYLDPQGRPLYLAAGRVVEGPEPVIAALGIQAQRLLNEIGDPDIVLERLGRAF